MPSLGIFNIILHCLQATLFPDNVNTIIFYIYLFLSYVVFYFKIIINTQEVAKIVEESHILFAQFPPMITFTQL